MEMAAQKGDLGAINNLGLLYLRGHGVPKNYKKAFELFQNAALKGDSLALGNLGMCYEYGYGVASDYKKAFDLYSQSCNQGVYESCQKIK